MINPTKISQVQDKIKKALEQIEKEEKIKISFGDIKYNAAFYQSPMKVITLDKMEKVSDVYTQLSKKLGFTQNIIGMSFYSPVSGSVTITDIKPRNRKYPVIGENDKGKSYKFTIFQVKRYIGGDKIINRNANLDKLLED